MVINAIKYAFPDHKSDARISVQYERDDKDWKLTVSDNGVGLAGAARIAGETGLGTTIVKALSKQLGATVEIGDQAVGLRTMVTKASFTSRHISRQVPQS